jgi:hypothetical protein
MGSIRQCRAVQVITGCILICTGDSLRLNRRMLFNNGSFHNANAQQILELFASLMHSHDIYTHNINARSALVEKIFSFGVCSDDSNKCAAGWTLERSDRQHLRSLCIVGDTHRGITTFFISDFRFI